MSPHNLHTGNPADIIRKRLTLINDWLYRVAWDGGEDELTSGWPMMESHVVRILSLRIFIYSQSWLNVDLCHAKYQRLGCAGL